MNRYFPPEHTAHLNRLRELLAEKEREEAQQRSPEEEELQSSLAEEAPLHLELDDDDDEPTETTAEDSYLAEVAGRFQTLDLS